MKNNIPSKIFLSLIAVLAVASAAASRTGTVVDSVDGKRYKTVTIGEQIWTAENMSLDINGGLCYDNKDANCKKFGRLYVWDAVSYVCPEGWHLPDKTEWENLLKNKKELRNLKALPAGDWDAGKFERMGAETYFWAYSMDDQGHKNPYVVDLKKGEISYASICKAYSVRCVEGEKTKDNGNNKFTRDIDKVLKDVAGLKIDMRKKGPRYLDMDKLISFCNEKSGGIGDGLDGLFNGGGGGIAARAKGMIETPSEDDVTIAGSRNLEDVMKVVRQRSPGFRHIYNKFLKKKPDFSGAISLEIEISPDGKVVNALIKSSTTGFAEFDNSVKSAISNWTFEAGASSSAIVTIPFKFFVAE